ncbi:heme lyase CcmF/NrfE family subunit [Sphaerisporangium fuscum]|uniref:heme lyase CcmF/NrfE family subunit n=1 Tax=Sphaerisporangium fuscum TaxID=2835868 RepID=UPI001BDBCA90|nr:cytochrome c-type biogenesis CcmF C-terminal domain-containing protein [Sphaerisporangium fuscum]
MKCLLGTLALWSGATISAFAALAWAVGARRRVAHAATAAALACAVAAFAVLEWALLGHDFAVGFVARNGGRGVPVYYTFTSLWSAVEGSLVLWVLVLAACAYAAGREGRGPHRRLAMAVTMTVCACFFVLVPLAADPFTQVTPVPADGPGPNPLLRAHPLMGVHPPLLYLGYIALVVPFAHGIASLMLGAAGPHVVRVIRRWTMIAWVALTAGIVLGARWSYSVLGWGGYWEWDPVENASIVPWFLATASAHALMLRERRRSLGPWAAVLAVTAFPLALMGTFLTRSGAVASVHSFTRSAVGPLLLGLLTAVLVATGGLAAWRADRLRHPVPPEGRLRPALFALNNALLITLAFTVLLGTLYPLVLKVALDVEATVGPPYFNRVTVPIALALVVLMAVAPLATGPVPETTRRLWFPTACCAASVIVAGLAPGHGIVPVAAFGAGAFALAAIAARGRDVLRGGGRVRRRLGGLTVHAGVALAAVAVAGSSAYAWDAQGRLRPGQTLRAGGYLMRLEGVEQARDADGMTVAARVSVSRDGASLGSFRPSMTFYPAAAAPPVANPAVRTGPLSDVYVTVTEVDQGSGEAMLRMAVNPLMALLWTSGAMMVLGALVAIPPARARRSAPAARPLPAPEMAGGPAR